MLMKKVRLIAVFGFAVVALASVAVASGAHESNNQFDLKPTAAAPADADGAGFANYLKGQDQAKGIDAWNSRVRVTGLSPNTVYTFYGENAAGTVQTAICSFTTDARGTGSCSQNGHALPAFAAARIRLGMNAPAGVVVLAATGAEVGAADNVVEDGEIERRGGCRSPDQGGEICLAPGQD